MMYNITLNKFLTQINADKNICENLRSKYLLSNFILIFALMFLIKPALYAQEQSTQESDQQISDFSLVGYGEKGKKTWDLVGKSADIFNEIIKLKDIVGNMYGKEEDIKLTADKGDFNKVDGNVHLQQNVVITTSSGAKLTTETLDWDRKNGQVTTKDLVNIIKENMVTTAYGATAEPNLNKVTLEKEVQVEINPVQPEKPAQNPQDKTIITCDGPLEIDYQKNIAVFKNNVKVDRPDMNIYSDTMDVYFAMSAKDNKAEAADTTPTLMGSKIEKIICRGNVKIVRGENVSYSDEAVYNALDKKVILSGTPKLIIYSTEDIGASFGN